MLIRLAFILSMSWAYQELVTNAFLSWSDEIRPLRGGPLLVIIGVLTSRSRVITYINGLIKGNYRVTQVITRLTTSKGPPCRVKDSLILNYLLGVISFLTS